MTNLLNNAPFRLTNTVRADQAVVKIANWNTLERPTRITAELSGLTFDIGWLNEASQQYNISSDPSNYVYIQLKALTADLPNRNLYNFTLDELERFEPSVGCQTYKTFCGKPTYYQHKQVLPEAKGFILGSDIVKEGPYDLVLITTAWDKKKDTKLAARAASLEKPAFFSMGCSAFQLVCSICKHVGNNKDNKCQHVKPPLRGRTINGTLCYEIPRKFFFTEESLVEVPADPRASRSGEDNFKMGNKILAPTI